MQKRSVPQGQDGGWLARLSVKIGQFGITDEYTG